MSDAPFSRRISAGDIPAGGKHFRLEAGEEERRRLAASLGIPDIASLSAEVEVRPLGGGTLAVRGELRAEVVQTDVVTLEPVRQEVAEDIDMTLLRAEDTARPLPRRGVPVETSEYDPPDLYRNGQVDLGTMVAEHLALGLDPYPRAAGVAFPGHEEDDGADDSRFAALASLLKKTE